MEVETLITIAVRLGQINRESAKESWDLAQSTGQMLTKLMQSLRQ